MLMFKMKGRSYFFCVCRISNPLDKSSTKQSIHSSFPHPQKKSFVLHPNKAQLRHALCMQWPYQTFLSQGVVVLLMYKKMFQAGNNSDQFWCWHPSGRILIWTFFFFFYILGDMKGYGKQESMKLVLEVRIEYLSEDSGILSSATYCPSVFKLQWCGRPYLCR